MRSATAFLPPCMITFMNLASSTLPYLGSGRISRLGTSRRRGISHLSICFSWPSRDPGCHPACPLTRPDSGSLRWISLPGLNEHRQTTTGFLSLLRALGAVLGAGLLAILHALQVQRTAHDVGTHTGQGLHAAATHQDHGVFLQVVAFTADVGDDFEPVGQAHLGD